MTSAGPPMPPVSTGDQERRQRPVWLARLRRFLLRLGRFTVWLPRWLFCDGRKFWFAIVPVFAVPCLISHASAAESFRTGGLALSLFGAGLALWNISETRDLFRHTGVLPRAKAWLLQPFLYWAGVELRVHPMTGSLSIDASLTTAEATHVAKTSALEHRIEAAEKNIEALRGKITGTQKRGEAIRSEMFELIQLESRTVASALGELGGRVEATAAKGLDGELIGLVWIIFGQVYATYPCELARGIFDRTMHC